MAKNIQSAYDASELDQKTHHELIMKWFGLHLFPSWIHHYWLFSLHPFFTLSRNFQDRMNSMNLSPLTAVAVKDHFHLLAVSAVWDGLLLQTQRHQDSLLWFPRHPAGSPRAGLLSQHSHHLLHRRKRLEKDHLLGGLQKMFCCQTVPVVQAPDPYFDIPKGPCHMVQRFAGSLLRVNFSQDNFMVAFIPPGPP